MKAAIVISRKPTASNFVVEICTDKNRAKVKHEVVKEVQVKKFPDDCPPVRANMMFPYLYSATATEQQVSDFITAYGVN